MSQKRKIYFQSVKRIVIKIGSGVLTGDKGLNLGIIRSISMQISNLIDKGMEVILVSSGAMSAGIRKIGLECRPEDIPRRQAVAAIGQAGLIMEYEKGFRRYQKQVAQILLTSDDLHNRRRYLNARNTLYTLLSWKVVPIINENDTVMVEEIQFGDNDNLAAMITLLMDADLLIILTDKEGLYTTDPGENKDAELISFIPEINSNIEKIALHNPGVLGTGGMRSKIRAAKKVTSVGIPMIIAKGGRRDILNSLLIGKEYGTFFIPKERKLASRKCWIAYTLKPRGNIIIDDGAASAILERGKSLLPSGIISINGEFDVGAPVEFRNTHNEALGIGLVNYSSRDISKIRGLKSKEIINCLGYKPYDEIIHRDNLVITAECADPCT
ncbi:MAG: glutamate 5-kinase [Spirochaetota bacterium]|nr:glutamate 5-kinase [Spirochaetota bacterium]